MGAAVGDALVGARPDPRPGEGARCSSSSRTARSPSRAAYPTPSLFFIHAPDFEELERRLRERATESAGEIEERLALSRRQLDQAEQCDFLIVNDEVERAADELCRNRSTGARWCSYHAHVIHPRLDELLDNVDSRYALVIVTAKRARQINNYYQQLGEGTYEDFPPPLVESRSKNYLTMAMEETAQGMIKYTYPK